jgi:riboflavin synthase
VKIQVFTGIIEGIGEVASAIPEGEGVRLDLALPRGWGELAVGGSLAVDGACLTVVSAAPGRATCQAIAETLRRTTLGELRAGARVNLERPLQVGDRLEGHWVQGHVDGRARLERQSREGASERLTLALLDPALGRYVVGKGSIALAGVSLTVGETAGPEFSIYLIPHTLAVTTLGQLRPGDLVNVEVDILAKYLEHLVGCGPPGAGGDAAKTPVDWAEFLGGGAGGSERG